MKRCSTLYVIRGMVIKTKMIYHNTCSRMTQSKMTDHIKGPRACDKTACGLGHLQTLGQSLAMLNTLNILLLLSFI